MIQYPIDIADFFISTGLLVLVLVLVEADLWASKAKAAAARKESHRDHQPQ
jgi:hypothetical protein